MLGRRFQDAASEDMGEQLVACLLEGGGGRNFSRFRTLFRHARRAPLFRSGARVRTARQGNGGPSGPQSRDAGVALAGRWGRARLQGSNGGARSGVPGGGGNTGG